MAQKPKVGGPIGATEPKLFCQCDIDLDDPTTTKERKKVEQFCESVVDSSRYFVLRIVDPRSGRAAHIGVGFRQRDDASNFRLALQDYERSLERERTAQSLQEKHEREETAKEEGEGGAATKEDAVLPEKVGKLTLKEGETIHINLKGHETTDKKEKKTTTSAVPLLLKKPPPPGAAATAPATATEIQISMDDMETPPMAGGRVASASVAQSLDSDGAIADDDEWNDFESPQT
eukprot:CAMPEP_0116560736 /NCGR_PEP_ID=MMETSP0397-20121206/11167_1 /TAXON_ID=216820 /ORGANISM="Cyclophora tenuis, Strain ECT3854" /LENGTH=232 /DNA_ID=CAMNT_0004086749 /DNA_START=1 /DNA_END=696 /DNA_ORIENTATION=+